MVNSELLKQQETGRTASAECEQEVEMHGKALTNLALLKKWRLLPLHWELAARKVGWLKSMLMRPGSSEQVLASVFGTIKVTGDGWVREIPTLDENGHISKFCPGSLAVAFEQSLLLYEGI